VGVTVLNPGSWPPVALSAWGEGLRAVPEEIPPGQNIILAEALVDFGDHAGQAIGRWSDRRGVWAIWAACVISRIHRLGHRNRMIRRGPWVSRQKSGDHRIGSAIGGFVHRDARGLGNARQSHDANFFLLAFVIQEEKSLVFHDRAADRASELVVVKRRFGLIAQVEEIARVQHVVAEILKGAAVDLVSSAAGDDVHHRAAVASVFRLEIGEHGHVAHGINRQDG